MRVAIVVIEEMFVKIILLPTWDDFAEELTKLGEF
jgi:hypothetical protein